MPETPQTPASVKPEDKKDADLEHILDHAEDLVAECKKLGKTFYKSKTVWFNILSIAVIVGVWLSGYPDYAEYGSFIIAGANLGLRFMTKEPLVIK